MIVVSAAVRLVFTCWRNIDKDRDMDPGSFNEMVEEYVHSWTQNWVDNLNEISERVVSACR